MPAISTNFQIDYSLADLTPRQLAEQIIGRLEKNFSVTLMPIFKMEELTGQQRSARFKDVLFNAILQRAESENLSDFFALPQSFTEREERDYLEAEGGDVGAQEIEPEPLMSLLEKDVAYVKSLRGEDLKNYVYNLSTRFENMTNAKSAGQLAAELLLAGLVSVGIPAGVGAGRALRAGMAILAAIRAGVLGIGLKTAVFLAVTVLFILLDFLFRGNEKKVLGIVIDQTDESFVVRDFRKPDGDLYVNAGSVKSFMEDNEEGLGAPKIQLRKRLSFGEGDEENIVFQGLYFIDKKLGIFGAEGLALFSSTTSDLRFAHLFGSPYTRDNGTNVAFVPGTDRVNLKKLFDDLYASRQVRVTAENEKFELAATVNAPRGGVVACIASITAKA